VNSQDFSKYFLYLSRCAIVNKYNSMRISSFVLEEVVLHKLYVDEVGKFMPILVVKKWSLSRGGR
jgi:hypothetical protein